MTTLTAENNRESAVVACTHCGQPVPPALQQPDTDEQFCCSGCRTVYGLLQDQGLQQYYDLREQFATDGHNVRPDVGADRYAVFGSDDFRERHIEECADYSEMVVFAEGVHCAACVWLIERLPQVCLVLHARVQIEQQTVHIRWVSEQGDPAQIARAMASLGYPVHP